LIAFDFRAVPLFASLSDRQLDQLHRLSHHRSYHPGETVFREGETGIGVYVVTSGCFELRHDSNFGDGSQEAILSAGEVFGLTSLLDDEPRRVSAYAMSHGTCAVMTRMTMRNAMTETPALAIEVIRSMAKSLRDVSALVERN
jgi:CRP-like cAMP-binding protein